MKQDRKLQAPATDPSGSIGPRGPIRPTAPQAIGPIRPTRPSEATGSRNGRIGSLREAALRRRVCPIPPHGGYQHLKSYQTTEIIYDLTRLFCDRFVHSSDRSYRTYDQMVQAARSGKQNIAEGSQASGTSKKTELKLVGVARASLEELLVDYLDYLRQHHLSLWSRDDSRVLAIRALAYRSNRMYRTYESYFVSGESAANCLVCLIHQASYLLDQQLRALEKDFLTNGGFTERLFAARTQYRSKR